MKTARSSEEGDAVLFFCWTPLGVFNSTGLWMQQRTLRLFGLNQILMFFLLLGTNISPNWAASLAVVEESDRFRKDSSLKKDSALFLLSGIMKVFHWSRTEELTSPDPARDHRAYSRRYCSSVNFSPYSMSSFPDVVCCSTSAQCDPYDRTVNKSSL